MSNTRRERIPELLNSLYEKYDRKFLPTDPISLVHRFKDPQDQEVVGLISALLAFGNALSIQNSVKKVLNLMGSHPAAFVASFPKGIQEESFRDLGHRWVRGADLRLLFQVLACVLRQYGSVKGLFLAEYKKTGVAPMLHGVSKKILSFADGAPLSRGFRYFFPSPEDGSPCKRLNMFLRWMVRPADGVDLGLWTEIPPSELIIPLDTHVYQFARRFRLSRYRSPNWRVAVDVTDFLRELDPADPVKYDFAICHHGMTEGW